MFSSSYSFLSSIKDRLSGDLTFTTNGFLGGRSGSEVQHQLSWMRYISNVIKTHDHMPKNNLFLKVAVTLLNLSYFLGFLRMDVLFQPSGHVYMVRFRLFEFFGYGLRIHLITSPDHDTNPHDHPFDFLSIVMMGGYTEWVKDPYVTGGGYERTWNVKSQLKKGPRFVRAEGFHNIVDLEDFALTMVFTFPKRREWSFYDEDLDKAVYWKDYLGLCDLDGDHS